MRNIFGGNNKTSSDKGEKEPLLGSMQEDNLLLIEAAFNGDTASVKTLLAENNIDINFQGRHEKTALYEASKNGHTEVVKELLKAGADANTIAKNGKKANSALYAASKGGHTGVVIELLKAGADPNTMTTNATATGKNRVSTLQAASLEGHDKIVEQLIIGGAALDIPTTDGLTPLMLASRKGHVKVVEKLVEAGAQINLKDKDGTSALLEACKIKNLDIAKNIADYLFKNGADSKCLLSPGRLYGEKINSKLDGVSDEMKKKIYELADPKNIEKRDRALAAKTQISPSLETHPITQEVLSPTSREGR